MNKCESCGNEYDKAFKVTMSGKEYTFDSFECAINRLAPQCSHGSTRIIGHGVESDNKILCCAHCAKAKGVNGLRDHAD